MLWEDSPEFIKRDLQVELKTGHLVNAANEAAARQKLLQIILGGIYDAKHNSHVIDAKPRIEEIERIISQTNRKVLIFLPLMNCHPAENRLKPNIILRINAFGYLVLSKTKSPRGGRPILFILLLKNLKSLTMRI